MKALTPSQAFALNNFLSDYKEDQEWTSIDDDALNGSFAATAKATSKSL